MNLHHPLFPPLQGLSELLGKNNFNIFNNGKVIKPGKQSDTDYVHA